MLDERYLVEAYGATVFRIATSYGLGRQDAEDVSQEVFCRLFESERAFSSDEHVKAWLIRVAVNLCNDYHRKNKTHTLVPLASVAEICGKDNPHFFYLQDLLDRLSSCDRLIIHLCCYEQYDSSTVAKMLGISPGAVRTRLHRIRKRMKEEWTDG